jgi:hypothetical protein
MLPTVIRFAEGQPVWREVSKVAGEHYINCPAVIEGGSLGHKLAKRERVWNASSVFHSHRYHPIEKV